jgi:hypothetical protein
MNTETRLADETVWLTQVQMVELFANGRTTIIEEIVKASPRFIPASLRLKAGKAQTSII